MKYLYGLVLLTALLFSASSKADFMGQVVFEPMTEIECD